MVVVFRFYCKYNYNNELYSRYAAEDLSQKTTELIHFLKKMDNESFWEATKDPYAEIDSKPISDSYSFNDIKNINEH